MPGSRRGFSRILVPTVVLTLSMTSTTVWAAEPPSASPSPTSAQPPPIQGIAAAHGEVIVPYGADDFRYRVYGSGTVPADWGDPGFDDTSFNNGATAFGSGGGCPIQAETRTNWPINSEIVVRRSIDLPPGATEVEVIVVIDNDVEVRWNGQDISGGVRVHEGCALRDDFVFAVPNEHVDTENTLAIRGRDRGGESFLDVKVTTMTDAVASNPVIMVHGINGDARNPVGPALEAPIVATFGAETLSRFTYYQDRAFRPDPDEDECQGVADPLMPAQPNGNMPVNPDSVDPATCDSQSDLALNAVLLHADVHRRFAETGKPVILIANSMGAAVVRGMLSYSFERGDGVAANEVDSVFFLQGAHDGAETLVAANKNGGRGIDQEINRAALNAFAGIDFERPAQEDLTPKSDWYRWANPGAGRLAANPYFNIYGDINIVHVPCFFFWCMDPRVIVPLGDVALSTGTDDPFDTPPKGGTRFLRGALDDQNWQWSMPVPIVWDPASDQHMLGAFTVALILPEMHGNFLTRMQEIEVPDCATGESIGVDQALLRVINGRLTGVPYECQP